MQRLVLAISMIVLITSCGEDPDEDVNGSACSAGMEPNPVTGECEAPDPGMDAGMNNTSPDDDAGNNTSVGDDTGDGNDDMAPPPDDTGMPEPDTDNGGGDMGTTGDWPPAIESLYEPGMCLVPDCDDQGDPGFDPSGDWIQTLTTTESDCSDFIKGQDDRANVGNVDESGPGPLDTYTGQCASDGGEHVGTATDGIAAGCDRNEQDFDVVSYETSVVEFVGDSGTGEVIVYLENVPSIVGDDCFMRFDVAYQRM